MDIKIRNISRTRLQDEAYLKLVKKYSSKLKNSVDISFDLRLKPDLYGTYIFDDEKKTHIIKISIRACCFDSKKKNVIEINSKTEKYHVVRTLLDANAEKYHIISTTIHELCHALQKEEKKSKFYNNKFRCAPDVRNPDIRDLYSECEVLARQFENKNILQAVQHYDSCCLS